MTGRRPDLVEIEGLEPSLTEPESVVLPLHHISMSAVNFKRDCKFTTLFLFCKFFLTFYTKFCPECRKSTAERPCGTVGKSATLKQYPRHGHIRHIRLCLIAKHGSPDLTALTAAHEAKLFGRRSLDRNTISIDPHHISESLTHQRHVTADFRALESNGDIRIAQFKTLSTNKFHNFGKKNLAVDPLPLIRTVRKMTANVTKGKTAQKSITKSMNRHVTVRVSHIFRPAPN